MALEYLHIQLNSYISESNVIYVSNILVLSRLNHLETKGTVILGVVMCCGYSS